MAAPNTTPVRDSDSNMPSSFDSDPDFLEGRFRKFLRRLREEPLIPLGCAATCYALYQATKSIKSGDHHQVNKMFRARIYAQGFTLVALVGGSIFWQDERHKRRELEKAVEEKKAAEKKEKWLRELERRDQEDQEWKERFEGVAQRAKEAEMDLEEKKTKVQALKKTGPKEKAGDAKSEEAVETTFDQVKALAEKPEQTAEGTVEEVKKVAKRKKESMKEAIDKAFETKSALEKEDRRGLGADCWAIIDSWRRR